MGTRLISRLRTEKDICLLWVGVIWTLIVVLNPEYSNRFGHGGISKAWILVYWLPLEM